MTDKERQFRKDIQKASDEVDTWQTWKIEALSSLKIKGQDIMTDKEIKDSLIKRPTDMDI